MGYDNITIMKKDLSNETLLSSMLRDIEPSEVTLGNLFIIEKSGPSASQIQCLMETTFLLNEIETDCTLGQIISLESLQWSIKNEFGKVNHIE